MAQIRVVWLDIALPHRTTMNMVQILNSCITLVNKNSYKLPEVSVTGNQPSVLCGGKDFSSWTKNDDLIYKTMRTPIENLLGRQGVEIADLSICESKFEKGFDVSQYALGLLGNLSHVQTSGAPEIEFATVGVIAKIQIANGNAEFALKSFQNLKEKFIQNKDVHLLPNVEAACWQSLFIY